MKRSWMAIMVAGLILLPWAMATAQGIPVPETSAHPASSGAEPDSVLIKLSLFNVKSIHLEHRTDGTYAYRLAYRDGSERTLGPQEFADLTFDNYSHRPFWQQFLNISNTFGIAWVTLGLLGQVLFTGRMIVQWLVSEKEKKSVVPVAFWWMSLGGATMLIIYFAWRVDIVGILGQATGWFIYIRNLWMIHRPGSNPPSVASDPAPEAELRP